MRVYGQQRFGQGSYASLPTAAAHKSVALVAVTASAELDARLPGAASQGFGKWLLHVWFGPSVSLPGDSLAICQYATAGSVPGVGIPAVASWPELRSAQSLDTHFTLECDSSRWLFRLFASRGFVANWAVSAL